MAEVIASSLQSEPSCGECTACCEILEIQDDELTKEAGELCAHCADSVGCMVQASKPQTCKDFECDYIRGYLHPSLRADICGVLYQSVVYPFEGELLKVMLAIEYHPGAFDLEDNRWVERECLKAGGFVFKWGRSKNQRDILINKGVYDKDFVERATAQMYRVFFV